MLVVVESVGDLWALERADATRGRYHVLGGALSPLDGVGPDDLNLASLVARVAAGGVKEVILAVNATVDGQTTAHYVTDLLAPYAVEGDAARAWRAGRRRTGLSRRRHARRRDAAAHGVLTAADRRSRDRARRDLSAALDERFDHGCRRRDSRAVPPAGAAPASRPLGALGMVYTLWRNPLEIWSRAHFEQPVLIGKTVLGVRAVVSDPAAVRRVFLDNAANYRKDALQLRVLRPGLGDRAADRRGRGLARAAARAGAAVFAAPGRGFRARDASGRARRGRAAAARAGRRAPLDVAEEMARTTLQVLEQTLFSQGLGARRRASSSAR